MKEWTLQACVCFPGAKSVEFLSDGLRQQLCREEEDTDWWAADIRLPAGPVQYRFLIDGVATLPDPFNSQFRFQDSQYSSELTHGERQEDFSEKPKHLFFADKIPAPHRPVRPVRPVKKVGPAHENLVAVLGVDELHRSHNHVLWVWDSPSMSRYFLDDIIRDSDSFAYCAIPYHAVSNFGTWKVTAFLNGRLCGSITTVVSPLTYSHMAPLG